jgi:hypothetical protein
MKDVHITLNVKDVDVRIVQDGRKRTNGIVNLKDVDVLILQYGRKKTHNEQ